jgi:hypothetical protein
MTYNEVKKRIDQLEDHLSFLELFLLTTKQDNLAVKFAEYQNSCKELIELKEKIDNSLKIHYIDSVAIYNIQATLFILDKKMEVLKEVAGRKELDLSFRESIVVQLEKIIYNRNLLENKLLKWYNTQEI